MEAEHHKPSRPHAVILSSPGMGHFRPVFQLGKLLTASPHNYRITIFLPTTGTTDEIQHQLKPFISSVADDMEIIPIPAPDISALVKPDAKVVKKLGVLMREIRSAFRSVLLALNTVDPKPTVLICQMFSHESISLAAEFKLRKYAFMTTGAWFLALTVALPVLEKEIKGQYLDQTEPLRIPGCKSVRLDDIPDPMFDREDPQYDEYKRMGNTIPMFDGVLVNTWYDLERQTLGAFKDDEIMSQMMKKVPVYPIGPLITRTTAQVDHDQSNKVIEWLDQQPMESVIYVSFGSAGTLSARQLTELAWGLELSQQRFVWVVRPPVDATSSTDASYLSGGAINMSSDPSHNHKVVFNFLPDGFIERTRDVGFLVQSWAPQLEILSHPSVGGFLSHCGWNSTLESITNGVPMITWPLHAEQRMNATTLIEELRMAIRPKKMPGNITVIEREEIKEMVRALLVEEQGHTLRKKVKELQCSGKTAFDEGGSSHNSLIEFFSRVEQIVNNVIQQNN